MRAAMTCELGWVKVTYQKRIEQDPAIQGRIEDIQGNLKRLQALAEKAQDPDTAGGAVGARPGEPRGAARESCSERVEVVVEKGMVIDKLLSESVLILDPTIRDFDEYQRASSIAQVMWFDEDRYYETFGYKPGPKATLYRAAEAGKNPQQQSTSSTRHLDRVLLRLRDLGQAHQHRLHLVQGRGGLVPAAVPSGARWAGAGIRSSRSPSTRSTGSSTRCRMCSS